MDALDKKDLPVAALLEEMCAMLEAWPSDALFAAARSPDIVVRTDVEQIPYRGSVQGYPSVSLVERYKTPQALVAGMARRDPLATAASLALLSRLDVALAGPYAIVLARRWRTIPGHTPAGSAATYGLHHVLKAAVAALSPSELRRHWRGDLLRFHWASLVPSEIQRAASAEALTYPPEDVLAMWLAGYFRVNAVEVPTEIRRAAPLDALLEALHDDRVAFRDPADVGGVLGTSPELETADQKLRLLTRIAPTSRTKGESRLVRWLIAEVGYGAAEQAVPRLRERYSPFVLSVLDKEELPPESLLDEMCALISRWTPAEVYAAALSKDFVVGAEGSGTSWFSDRYATPEDCARSLARRDRDMRGACMAILSRLDLAAATPYALVLASLRSKFEGFAATNFAMIGAVEVLPLAIPTVERADVRSLWQEGVLCQHPPSDVPRELQLEASREALTLPADQVMWLWLHGRFDYNAVGVPIEIQREVPIDDLLNSIREGHHTFTDYKEVDAFIEAHPATQTAEQRLALLERLAPVACAPGEYTLVWGLIERLGRDRVESAVPLLLRLRRTYSVDATLLAIGTRTALETVAAEFDGAVAKAALRWDPHHVVREFEVPIQAIFMLDPATSVDRFARYFSDEAISTDAGAKVACDILSIGCGVTLDHGGLVFNTEQRNVIAADPRWIDVAARLADHRLLWRSARDVLCHTDKRSRQAALKRARATRSIELAASKLAPSAIAAQVSSRWIGRYLAGEHTEVWEEIHAADAEGLSAAGLPGVESVVRETMRRVRLNLERSLAWLRSKGKTPKRALPGPVVGAAAPLAALEAVVKGPIPLTLRCFFEEVGPVDFSCAHVWAHDWMGDSADPLVVLPPSKVLSETRYFRAKWNGGLPRDLWKTEPFLYLAPSEDAKRDQSESANETPAVLEFRQGAVDGMFRRGLSQMRFVDYLRTCCAGAGFEWNREPGARCDPRYSRLSEGLISL